ncbi:MAG: glycosyltransferase family 2 protein [Candidatus Omnitrophota bacterium]|jgi:glycosyltransferase involved in cell wall biosynthesis|nr:MAG: glycosyltransferase family 2 protein [Candidatus Omnitrophota bacterium]
MTMDKKISLSCFFPCFNDAGSIASMVVIMDKVARQVSDDYEIIVVDDCSTDNSRVVLEELCKKYTALRLIYHERNEGYGGALRSGIYSSKKEFIFYTDGDFQYDVTELNNLISCLGPGVDIVNGYKLSRSDSLSRKVIGGIYQYTMKLMFGFKIRDVDCDFRLMRRSIFDKIKLRYNSGVICVEMIKKIQNAGFSFAETGVSHYHRVYGKSQFFNIVRIYQVGRDILKLWWTLNFKERQA